MCEPALIANPIDSGDVQSGSRNWSWKDILTIVVVGVIANILIIAIPGFYSHDELDWQNRIARDDYPWSFGLGNFTLSPFFRLFGAIFISASLYSPLPRIWPTFCWRLPPRASFIEPSPSSDRTAPLRRPFFFCSCPASLIRSHG